MNHNKLETISNLFEGKEIRSVWNSETEDYYFSVVGLVLVTLIIFLTSKKKIYFSKI